MSSKFTVISLFSGIGGLDLGFKNADFKTIWANEISENAAKTFELNFGLKPIVKDINDIMIDDIPDGDVIIGGPPCQSFSLVGQRKPDDDRGKLVFNFFDIIKQKKPPFFRHDRPSLKTNSGMPVQMDCWSL